MKTCSDFPGAPGCCLSCHEDANEYGFDLCRVTLKEGEEAAACCSVVNWLEARGLTK